MPKARSAAATKLKPGDKVVWNSTQGEIEGHVVRKATAPTRIKSHKVDASPEAPQFVVKSDRTGAQAAHKPESLKKASSGHAKKSG